MVFLVPMMARTSVLDWGMDGMIPGSSSTTSVDISCPKYLVASNTDGLWGCFSWTSLSNEYCMLTVVKWRSGCEM